MSLHATGCDSDRHSSVQTADRFQFMISLLVSNGSIDGRQLAFTTRLSGVTVGRIARKNPWLIAEIVVICSDQTFPSPMTRTRARYEFGDFILDVGQQCLLRSDTGAAIALTGKVFDTLVCLVEHAGETLDKDVLLQTIWPGVIVEENSLTQNISTLRQVLGEVRGENRYIATIARKGLPVCRQGHTTRRTALLVS